VKSLFCCSFSNRSW